MSDFFPREGNNRILLAKVDYQMNNAHRLTAQYNLHRWDSPSGVQTQPTFSVAENANGKDVVKTDFFLLTLNSVLSQRMVNEFRFQTGRDFEAQEPNGTPPSTTITNGIAFGMPDFLPRPKYPEEWRYQVVNSLNYYAGSHSIKTGIDINYVRENVINLFNGGGVYAYGSLQNIAQDCPKGASGCTPTLTGATSRSPSLQHVPAGVRPARQRVQRRRVLHDHRLQLLRPGHLAVELASSPRTSASATSISSCRSRVRRP